MAIIQITSENPDFGFIIRKNPSSGMQLKSIRQGTAFGWYSKNDTAFNIFFKDADNAVSFGDQEFEYLNTSRYNSPVFVLGAIGEFFSSTVKEQIDIDVDDGEKTFFVNMVEIRYLHQVKHFEKYFPEFSIELEHKASKSYSLKITTSESFHKLFNYMNLMMMFLALTSEEYMQLDQSSVEKYLNSIERLDAPFFIRYLFSRNMFRSKKQFEKYKDRLENTQLYTSVNMAYGDTAMQRRTKIQKLMTFDKPILDVGCGEGFYAIPFAMNIKDHSYHAIDIEESLTNSVKKKAAKKDLTNIEVYNHIDEFLKTYDGETKFDIILTEVIEHMPIEDSKRLIQRIVNSVNFDKFIVTVPNKEFNQYYMIGENEFRHDDHNWEPTKLEFIGLMQDEIPMAFKMDFMDIGDTIDGISTSIGCLITKG